MSEKIVNFEGEPIAEMTRDRLINVIDRLAVLLRDAHGPFLEKTDTTVFQAWYARRGVPGAREDGKEHQGEA